MAARHGGRMPAVVTAPSYDQHKVSGMLVIKAIILGRSSVGKTALMRRYVHEEFRDGENTVCIVADSMRDNSGGDCIVEWFRR